MPMFKKGDKLKSINTFSYSNKILLLKDKIYEALDDSFYYDVFSIEAVYIINEKGFKDYYPILQFKLVEQKQEKIKEKYLSIFTNKRV